METAKVVTGQNGETESEASDDERSGYSKANLRMPLRPLRQLVPSTTLEPNESLSDIIRRRRAELQVKIDEITGNAAATPVPTTPPGMSRQKRLRCHGGSKTQFANISHPCCGNSESGTQTEVFLPHIMRDVLWTASSLDPVVDFDDDNAGIAVEAHAGGPSVLTLISWTRKPLTF